MPARSKMDKENQRRLRNNIELKNKAKIQEPIIIMISPPVKMGILDYDLLKCAAVNYNGENPLRHIKLVDGDTLFQFDANGKA